MAKIDPKIEGSIDVLIDYKNGGLTLAQTVDRFSKLTGVDASIAEQYIRELGRNNIISLDTKRKVAEKKDEPDIAG